MAKWLCLDVGTYSIKSLLMETQINKYELHEFHENILPENFRDLNQYKAESRDQDIKSHLASNYSKVDDLKLMTAISGDKTVVKHITFPFRDRVKIKNTLRFELENYVPFELDDWVVEHVIQYSDKISSIVLAVACSNSDVGTFISEFSKSSLEPVKFSSDSLSLANLSATQLYTEGCYALINIGHSKTNITVLEHGIITLCRSIPMGGYHLTDMISNTLKLKFIEAEDKKHNEAKVFSEEEFAEISGKDKPFYNTIINFSSELTKHVKQSVYSLKAIDRGMIEKIYLCGGTSRIRGLDKFLAKEIKVNVSDCKLGGLEENKIGIDYDKNLVPPVFAIGLRALNIKRPTAEINFRRGQFSYAKEEDPKQLIYKKGIKYSTIACLIFLLLFIVKCNNLKSQEKEVYKEIMNTVEINIPDIYKKVFKKDTPVDDSVISKLNKTITEKQKEIDNDLKKLDEIEKAGTKFIDILREMSVTVPNEPKFDIYKFDYGNNRIQIDAKAQSLTAISKIVKSLNESSLFINAKDSDTKQVDGGYEFKLRFEQKQTQGAKK